MIRLTIHNPHGDATPGEMRIYIDPRRIVSVQPSEGFCWLALHGGGDGGAYKVSESVRTILMLRHAWDRMEFFWPGYSDADAAPLFVYEQNGEMHMQFESLVNISAATESAAPPTDFTDLIEAQP